MCPSDMSGLHDWRLARPCVEFSVSLRAVLRLFDAFDLGGSDLLSLVDPLISLPLDALLGLLLLDSVAVPPRLVQPVPSASCPTYMSDRLAFRCFHLDIYEAQPWSNNSKSCSSSAAE